MENVQDILYSFIFFIFLHFIFTYSFSDQKQTRYDTLLDTRYSIQHFAYQEFWQCCGKINNSSVIFINNTKRQRTCFTVIHFTYSLSLTLMELKERKTEHKRRTENTPVICSSLHINNSLPGSRHSENSENITPGKAAASLCCPVLCVLLQPD